MRHLKTASGVCVLLAAATASAAVAGEASTTRRYRVTEVALSYRKPAEALPPVQELKALKVELAKKKERYTAPGDAEETTRVALKDVGTLEPPVLGPDGIRQITRAIVAELNRRGFGGVDVSVAPGQIGKKGRDRRPEGETSLKLVIRVRRVTEVRTRGRGDRLEGEQRVNHPAHRRIVEHSPVKPRSEAKEASESLLRSTALQEYTHWLNRHPGRRVSVAVTEGKEPGTLGLEYLVQEDKPWRAFVQISNTGTEQTNEYRQRFGFRHHQLTNNDDTLSLSYSTASFGETRAFTASYEAPLVDRLRWKVEGSYSEFVASEVGRFGQDFFGENYSFGGELKWNVFQAGRLFADLVGGATYQRVKVTNEIFAPPLKGEESFFRPRVGLRLERSTRAATTQGAALVEWNAADVAGTSPEGASKLGRRAVDENWALFRGRLSQSVYLEPLLNREAWEDVSTPSSSTLAHEVKLRLSGQQVFDDRRVIPQVQKTVGGLYTVRGYRESAVVGDNAVVVSAEYRYHVPQAFPVADEPGKVFGKPFRWAPTQPQGRADWDLVLKGFVDYGRTSVNDPRRGEVDEELLGAGVGMELSVLRNFRFRVDWGHALKDAANVADGSSQVHLVATIIY